MTGARIPSIVTRPVGSGEGLAASDAFNLFDDLETGELSPEPACAIEYKPFANLGSAARYLFLVRRGFSRITREGRRAVPR